MKQETILQPKLSRLIFKTRQKNKLPQKNKPPICGNGPCWTQGCGCQMFQGNNDYCAYCGHAYYGHG